MQTETTTQPFHEWEPARRERLKIAGLGVVMDDIDQTIEWGSRLYGVLDCYRSCLWRQHSRIPTRPSEREQMKTTIHTLDDIFHELMEQPEAEGWYYGIYTADNLAYGLANLLIAARNELLCTIAIRH
jgi:hypothetical protein